MTKDGDFKLLKIQTCVLKVNIHCDGCKQKVKKLLQRIEGVYQVNIDAEQQKVAVSGSVDSSTLIKKLVRAGKHAEIWSQKSNQNQMQKNNCIKDDKDNKGQKQGMIKGLEAFKNQQQHKFTAFSSEEDDDYFDDDEEEEEEEEDDDEEDELRFLRPSQLSLLRRQIDANNAKKNIGAMAPPNSGNKMTNNIGNGNNAQKKGNPNQNMGMKVNHPGVIDQKAMAALKMNNAHQFGGNINSGEGKRGNDVATMMNLAGFHGNGGNVANSANHAAGLGGNPYGLGGFQQVQSNIGFQGSSGAAAAGLPNGGYGTGQYPSSVLMNMNGYNNHPASMMMNMQNRPMMQNQQQPQMMYHRSPFIPPNTGYYPAPAPYPSPSTYTYPSPSTYTYTYPYIYPCIEQQPPNYNYNGENSAATHMLFSDENNSGSCSIM